MEMYEKVLHMSPTEMTNISYDCPCGRTHAINIGELLIGRGVRREITRVARPYREGNGKVMIVADCHTWEVLGREVEQLLRDDMPDAPVVSYVFPDHHLIPNAQTFGTLLIEASEEPLSLMIAVGSGTINDTTRFISNRLGIPYVIMGTAPSMDGYAGDNVPTVCRGSKVTFYAHYARSVILDTEILATAPQIMVCAGFGDIIGKYIALSDWMLAHKVRGEYYCPHIAALMENAVKKCVESIDLVAAKDPDAMQSLAEALCLAGMAMGLSSVTRPASGSEHHMTHWFDIHKIKNGQDYPLHGNSVGVCAVVMSRFYEMAFAEGHLDIEPPKPAEIRALLAKLGSPMHPRDLDIDRETFRQCLLEAKDLRPRYAVLMYAHEQGFLEEYVERIVAEFYDN